MDQALVIVTDRDPPAPDPTGAWILVSLVFMCGMLFQAYVPRLCQVGMKKGGRAFSKLWRNLWENSEAVISRMEEPRYTFSRESIIEPPPSRPLSMEEIRGRVFRGPVCDAPDTSIHRPTSSIWGPSQPRGRSVGKRGSQAAAMGAMLAAALATHEAYL